MIITFNTVGTFSEMQIVCSEFPTESLDGHDRYILGDSLHVCEASIDLYPDDVPYDTNCFPVEVCANGDSFLKMFHSLSAVASD
jgi:hypothetical protein